MSNGYLSYDDGVRTDPNTIFKGGRARAWSSAGSTDGDALPDIDVGPQDRLRTDDDSAKVPDIQSWADAGGGGDIEAVFEFVAMKHGSVVDIREDPERFLPSSVEGDLAEVVGKVESGLVEVCGQKGAACCLAAVPIEVCAQGLPKDRYQFSFSFLPAGVSLAAMPRLAVQPTRVKRHIGTGGSNKVGAEVDQFLWESLGTSCRAMALDTH